MLGKLIEVIDGIPEIQAETMEAAIRQLCEQLEWKPRDLFMPVRIAVTGRKATPPLFETMEVLGKERCRRRLRAAVTHLKSRL
ncbi:MAG: hypothetical protein R3C68_19795 [Myxococcota bacterium]